MSASRPVLTRVRGRASVPGLRGTVCCLALVLTAASASGTPSLDDGWMPPWDEADLYRAADGTIYWTAERRTPEANSEPTLWRIELDDSGGARAVQRIARPSDGTGKSELLGLAPDGGAWWSMRCRDPRAWQSCTRILRTDSSGEVLGWAPEFPGRQGQQQVDAAGDLLWWRTVSGDQAQRSRDVDVVFERWRLRAVDLRITASGRPPEGSADDGSVDAHLEMGVPASPWRIDATFPTPSHWSEPERLLDEQRREERLRWLRRAGTTGAREPFCVAARSFTIGPGVLAFSRLGCEQSRFAVYHVEDAAPELLWEAVLPTNPHQDAAIGSRPDSPIRWDPEAPRFGSIGSTAVAASGAFAIANFDSWTHHSREQAGSLVFFDEQGRLSGGLDVEHRIVHLRFDPDQHLVVSEAAPRGTRRGEVVRRLALDGRQMSHATARPVVWDEELEEQRDRAHRLTSASALDDWLALYRWAPRPALYDRIADAWADDPLGVAQRLGDRALREASGTLCARHPGTAPEVMLERFRSARLREDRVLSRSRFDGITLVEASGQAAWLVVLATCFPTPDSAPPDALEVARNWREDERLRRYAEIALEAWTPSDERADALWQALRSIAAKPQLRSESMERRVTEATSSEEAALLVDMFPKSRARIEQALQGDPLDRAIATQVAAAAAQAVRRGKLGYPGRVEVDTFVQTLRAWSGTDHALTADLGALLWLGLVGDLELAGPPPTDRLRAALARSVDDLGLLAVAEMNLQFAARHHLDPNWRAASPIDFTAPLPARREVDRADRPSFLEWLGLTAADVQPWLRHLFDLRLEADRRSVQTAVTGEALPGDEPPRVATHLLQALKPVGHSELLRYLHAVSAEFGGGRHTGLEPGFRFHDLASWFVTGPEDWTAKDLGLVLDLAETATDSRTAECRLLAAVHRTEDLPNTVRARAAARAHELVSRAGQGSSQDYAVDLWLPVCRIAVGNG